MACSDPTRFPAGCFSICAGCYDIPVAYVEVDGVYTNKLPGGVAYRRSFRVTGAAYLIERMIAILAIGLGLDAADLRRMNVIRKGQFPYQPALDWEYDSGDCHTACDKVMAAVDCGANRRNGSRISRQGKRGSCWTSA